MFILCKLTPCGYVFRFVSDFDQMMEKKKEVWALTVANGLNPGVLIVCVVWSSRWEYGSLHKDCCRWLMRLHSKDDYHSGSQKSVTNNSLSEDYSHPDDHTRQTTLNSNQRKSSPFDIWLVISSKVWGAFQIIFGSWYLIWLRSTFFMKDWWKWYQWG